VENGCHAAEIAGKEDEGEDGGADQRAGDDFSQNIASEDADPHKMTKQWFLGQNLAYVRV